MKKVIFLLAILWLSLNAFANSVKANEYNTAVIGHVVSETLKGTDIDHTALLEAEMSKIAHQFALQMTFVMQKHLPQILEGLAADIRLQADNKYKCKLLEGGTYECKE
tara:strand:+ start:212 stop:535 length:324 start_codon:yes stop_codon:yes gene_type:complete